MAIEFKLQAVAEGVESADVAAISVAEGDTIEAGQIVMEVETEKAAVDIECPHAGRIAKIHVAVGETVPVGGTLLTIEPDAAGSTEQPAAAAEPAAEPAQEAAPAAAASPATSDPAPAAAPAAGEGDVQQADVVVLGGGPGGYPAAFEAAMQGMNVTLVTEDEQPGGVCLHRGCIPSKALLHMAKLIHEAREAAEWGVSFGEPEIDLDKLRAFRQSVVDQLVGGVAGLCKTRGVNVIHARGTFLDAHTLQLKHGDGHASRLQFKTCITATGSLPAMPPFFDIGDDRVMDSTGALELPEIPERLLVIGGGYIGLEMGSVYAALGTKVTVVEMTSGLLPGADRDLVRPLAKRLKEQFEAIHLNTKVAGLRATDEGIVAKLESDSLNEEQTFGRVLVSVGRRPNSRNLGLENTNVVVNERGFIEVNAKQQTAEPSILAVGDVAGEPMLAHKATREGRVAVEALAGEPAEFDAIAIPAVVFTDPELAWCGLTEAEAKEQGRKVQVFRFPWAASGRAQTLKRTEGLTKLICEEGTERILGMGIVGAGAGELIAEGVLAVENALVARDVAGSIHAHPTLSETVMEAAEGIFSEPTHMHRPQRKKS